MTTLVHSTVRRGRRNELKRLRVGQVVHLTGFLVDATSVDGASVRTSPTRSDTGPGSREIPVVDRVYAYYCPLSGSGLTAG
jgi:hypothetical protein